LIGWPLFSGGVHLVNVWVIMAGKTEIELPTFDDICTAQKRLCGRVVRTPLIKAHALSLACRRPVYLKAECLQFTGSFKFRGAYNKISQIESRCNQSAVVAMSSGNHAQGVAAAAALMNLKAAIVMPADAPRIKRERTRGFGAQIVDYNRQREDRDAIAQALAKDTGAILIPPYDDRDVIAGQGTAGLEICEDIMHEGLDLDAVVVPAGGGGFAAGVGLAVKTWFPDADIFVAEPERFDDHARSLEVGKRCSNACTEGSICDALLARSPGEITFEINRHLLCSGFVLSDLQVVGAMAHIFEETKLVSEPGGAIATAALIAGMVPEGLGAVVAVLSGGNIDLQEFCRLTDKNVTL
jgi:threonine dehydratase